MDAYQNVPENPKVKLILACDDERFEYEFTIDNQKFKADTRTAEINKTIEYKGKKIKLTKLTAMPTAHTIQFEKTGQQDLFDVVLHGTDNLGNEVTFSELGQANVFLGNRENHDGSTYELSHAVSSYTLRMYDINGASSDDLWNEKNAVSDEFTVNLR